MEGSSLKEDIRNDMIPWEVVVTYEARIMFRIKYVSLASLLDFQSLEL